MASGSCDKLKPSPWQLRSLWDFDNQCAHKYMGVPLRQCSSIEPPDGPGSIPLHEAVMSVLRQQIEDMWLKTSTILDIFNEDNKPELGHRLRVKPDVPIRVSMKPNDQLVIGWKAVIPSSSDVSEACPSSHLYYRSDMAEHNQYLGGPVSYSNYAPSKEATLIIRQVSHGSSKHLVRAENTKKVLTAGTELLWDYGKKDTPEFPNDWFQPECCSISVSAEKKKSNDQKTPMEVYKELCTLCGKPYKANRRDWTGRKCQKKVHLLSSHANFLGTDWDGCTKYDPLDHNVDYRRALIASERLIHFLKRLESDSWKVVPACVVMSKQEQETLDPITLMKVFARRCNLLKKLGSVVVRGNSAPTMVDHLHPVKPLPWNVIFSQSSKPKRVYALPEKDRLTLTPEIKDDALQDVYMVLNIRQIGEADDSSSEDL